MRISTSRNWHPNTYEIKFTVVSTDDSVLVEIIAVMYPAYHVGHITEQKMFAVSPENFKFAMNQTHSALCYGGLVPYKDCM